MTPQQIEYVLTLSEEKSFSKAAQRLYITQPSLSQFIKNLEGEIGAQLFDRSTFPIRLTPAGEVFVEAAGKIKAVEEELYDHIADLSNLKTGNLKIGTSPFRASCLLPKSIAEFHKKYPGVSIHIMEDEKASLEKAALEGSIDLYIGTGPFDERVFYTEALAEEQLYLAVPGDCLYNNELQSFQVSSQDIKYDTVNLHKTPSVDLAKFQTEQFIFQQHKQKLSSLALEICESYNFEPKIILYSDRLETAFSWVLAGIGLSFLPDFLIRFGNYEKHPIYYKIDYPEATRHLYVAYRKNRYLSRVAVEYIAVLKQLIGYGTWNISE
ncbi:LysR family transcriptional regulator [Mobilitalea sibirica]|uniref:LysR family transcriptional regulator n=1 Tax=Mobilitalea sibirica TaxID=1462919 RepID=A0A8J7KVT5_9FIRM|nr:LysR family transcriptional regulator [Mobilitalea sibirica]MBH1939537.1 LysR family transcriptional regulator [Mobilitalea sibirica]